MKSRSPSHRVGTPSRAAMLAAFILLTALCLQVLPFTFQQPLPTAAADDGAARYFQPLQVCGDRQGPGGFVADIPWISPSPCTMVLTLAEKPFVTESSPDGSDGFSWAVFRPPRRTSIPS